MDELDTRLQTALAVATEAGALALTYFERRGELVVENKGPQDLVTAADREVETLIRRRLGEAFPGDGVLGEEQGGGAARALWVVDPIDGTTNFVHGLAQWGVSIAFVLEGQCELGVIAAPVLRETFVARRGRGATCNGRPIAASRCAKLDEAVVGFGGNRRNPLPPYLERLSRVLSAGAEYRRLGSAVINLSSVACGRLDAYFEQHLSSWDALAGMLLVSEAGGRCNDFLRGDGLTKGNPVLVAGAGVYDALATLTGIR